MAGFWKCFFRDGCGGEEEVAALLRKVPIFEGLEGRDLAAVERIIHRREYQADEVIIHQGAAGFGMYIIVKGMVRIVYGAGNQTVAELGEGEFFGELSLLDNSPRSAAAIATTPCKLLGFFQSDLFGLIERHPRLGVKIISRISGIIGERLRQSNEQVHALQNELSLLKARHEAGQA